MSTFLTAVVAGIVIGFIAFDTWHFRRELRQTHKPARKPKPYRVPVDLDAEDRRRGGSVPK